MKKSFKKILSVAAIFGIISLFFSLTLAKPTFAAFTGRTGSECQGFLGLTSWDCNVDIHDEESLKTNIWLIVSNIADDIAIVAAYLVIGYVIYGGYVYTFSNGETNRVENGKKTLMHAFIGLAIVISAKIIVGSIRIALVGGNGNIANCVSQAGCVSPGQMVENLIGWFTAIAGVVSAVFLVYGGILYIFSTGDAQKVNRAKNMIIYSLIGLTVVALAVIITNFVSRSINSSIDETTNSRSNNLTISKEVHEIKINC